MTEQGHGEIVKRQAQFRATKDRWLWRAMITHFLKAQI